MTAAPTDPVVVLAGGLSAERDVSMRSADRLAALLDQAGHASEVLDAEADVLGQLAPHSPAAVWPVLHGAAGEDGTLAELLRLTGLPVVGTDPQGCRLAWDKSVSSGLARAAGLAVPAGVTVTRRMLSDIGAHTLLAAVIARLGLPVVVKPRSGGSGFGVSLARSWEDVLEAVVGALGHDSACRVERCIAGREATVTVVDTGDGPTACPAVEIAVMDGGGYDFSTRYTAGAIEFHVPARLEATSSDRLASGAVEVHRRLGLGTLSRSDWIVDDAGVPWFVEVNTSPGLTDTSTTPLGLAALGDLPQVVSALVAAARPLD